MTSSWSAYMTLDPFDSPTLYKVELDPETNWLKASEVYGSNSWRKTLRPFLDTPSDSNGLDHVGASQAFLDEFYKHRPVPLLSYDLDRITYQKNVIGLNLIKKMRWMANTIETQLQTVDSILEIENVGLFVIGNLKVGSEASVPADTSKVVVSVAIGENEYGRMLESRFRAWAGQRLQRFADWSTFPSANERGTQITPCDENIETSGASTVPSGCFGSIDGID